MSVIRFAALVLGLALVPSLSFAQGVHGVLRVVKGDVKIKSGTSGQTAKARIGEKVYPKDILITAKDSRAKIVMVDNNEINVSPESQIEIQNYEYDPNQGKKNVLLNVIYGKVRSKVEQKYDGKGARFQIKTPSAVAGVRGTDFLTSYNRSNNSSSVVTFEGRVEFGLPGPNGTIQNPVFVSPGTVASNQGFTPPSAPVPVPKEELAKMDTDTRSPGDGVKTEEPRMPAGEEKKDKDDKKKEDGGQAQPDKKSGENKTDDKNKTDDSKKSEGDKRSGNSASGPKAGDSGQASASNESSTPKPAGDSAPASGSAPPNASNETSAPRAGEGSASTSPSGDSNAPKGETSAPSRQPASAAPRVEFRPPPPPPPPRLDIMPPPPVVGPPPVFVAPNPNTDFIRGVIESGKTNLIIKVNNN